jgi:AcrR family transcriptional regulator
MDAASKTASSDGSASARRTGDRRTRILDSACAAIALRGVRGLRVEEVAAGADVSVTLLYYYFGSRQGLVQATLRHANSRAPSGHPLDLSTGNSYDAVRGALVREISDDEATRENSSVWGEVMAAAVFEPDLRMDVHAAVGEWTRHVAEAIDAGRRDGSIREDVDPAEAAQHLTALVDGLSNRWLAGGLSTNEARTILERAVERELARR